MPGFAPICAGLVDFVGRSVVAWSFAGNQLPLKRSLQLDGNGIPNIRVTSTPNFNKKRIVSFCRSREL
jgi:hypothetical protein